MPVRIQLPGARASLRCVSSKRSEMKVLQPFRLVVHLFNRVVEDLEQKRLEQPMMPQHFERAPPSGLRQAAPRDAARKPPVSPPQGRPASAAYW